MANKVDNLRYRLLVLEPSDFDLAWCNRESAVVMPRYADMFKVTQLYIDRLLAKCEFSLTESPSGLLAHLRIPPAIAKCCPWFWSLLLDRLHRQSYRVVWSGMLRSGWFVLQFQSTVSHYLSLSSRCRPSNLKERARQTLSLLYRATKQQVDRFLCLAKPFLQKRLFGLENHQRSQALHTGFLPPSLLHSELPVSSS